MKSLHIITSVRKKTLNRLFAIAMLLPATFLFLYAVNSGTHHFIEKTIFKWNKNTLKVKAKVLGWDFTAHHSRKSGSSFSYDYGVVYTFKNHKYFGLVEIVSHTKDKNGERYYKPLPQSIAILIDTEKPQYYIYEYKKETINIFLSIIFLAITAACIYCLIRPETSFYFKTPHKGLSPRINNLLLNLLAFVPFVFCYFVIKNAHNGNETMLIDGYEIISNRTSFATEINNNVTCYKGQVTNYISMEMDKKYLQASDTLTAYIDPSLSNYYKIPIEKKEHASSVQITIYKTPKEGFVYLITPKGRYIATPYLYH